MKRNLKEPILKLRNEGKTYPEICKILGCTRGTVAYHCGDGQKEKAKKRNEKFRDTNPIARKRDTFLNEKRTYKNGHPIKSPIALKTDRFQSSRCNGKYNFSTKQLREKLEANPYCYLTGTKIDLNEPSTYHLDHIIPVSLGGESTLDNVGLTTAKANLAKRDLMLDDFLHLCQQILEHQGFMISK